MVRLNFAVVGEELVGVVDIEASEPIHAVRIAIKEMQQYSFSATELMLFTTKRADSTEGPWLSSSSADLRALQKTPLSDDMQQEYLNPNGQYKLNPASLVSKYFPDAVQSKVVHVLVCLPERLYAPPSRKRAGEALETASPSLTRLRPSVPVDSTQDWLHRFGQHRIPAAKLPPVSELRAFVEAALPVPIPIHSMNLWPMTAMVQREEMNKLFTEDNAYPCATLYMDAVYHVLKPMSPAGSAMASFISHWHSLISRPLKLTAPDLRLERHTKRDTIEAMERPDLVCTLDGVCVFRGEEASPQDDIRASREQLRNHSRWTYGSAPYVLAYATSGYDCKLYALVAGDDQHHHQLMDTVEIASFRTKNPEDRIRLLLAMIQLTRLFEAIVSLCPDTARDEFHDIVRPNGVVIRLNPQAVEKRFPREARWSNIVSHLKQVYRVIQTHSVPHTDQLIHNNGYEDSFTFTPRGDAHRPKTMNELFTAISQVLECLVALHDAGWMHRDLRWDNVMKRRDVENQWFVIDFADAAPSPKQNNVRYETLNTRGHAPEIFVEGANHSTAVDLWCVGAMIEACELSDGEMWFYCEERDKLLMRLLAKDPAQRPTAAEALVELKRLQVARRSQ